MKNWKAHPLHTFKYTEIRKVDQGCDSAPSWEKKTPNLSKFYLLFVTLLSQVAILLFPDLHRLETLLSQSRQEDNNN